MMTPEEFSDFNSTFGLLRKIFPQKKFEDPKMAEEFFTVEAGNARPRGRTSCKFSDIFQCHVD